MVLATSPARTSPAVILILENGQRDRNTHVSVGHACGMWLTVGMQIVTWGKSSWDLCSVVPIMVYLWIFTSPCPCFLSPALVPTWEPGGAGLESTESVLAARPLWVWTVQGAVTKKRHWVAPISYSRPITSLFRSIYSTWGVCVGGRGLIFCD